ncbi:lysophospholipid acyltransferase family protein [Butyricimonas synergistica]|uniref:lysophospholipid acyltransferase family protein n=1 Tax=Butyricimonas synergistica TaxID=544644 RepID=UPI00037D228D|nr:lysophospholipid acyltransferase family protein [Butyricimonas synergistica]
MVARYKRVLAAFYRGVLSVRYRVHLKGEELLKEPRTTLFLPNHQASVDPQIVCSQLLRYTDVSPLVTEGYFKIPIVAQILHLMGAVRVPDLEKSRRGVEVVAGLSKVVVDALASGRNVLIYPAGQLTNGGLERVGNKQGTWQVCRQLPDGVRVVGVRIQGLWGSMWSRAKTGKSPDFLWTYLKGIFYVLANLIFFVPRRDVTITFEDITEEAIRYTAEGRQPFNRFLESFYNVEGEEKKCCLKHFFYN